MSTVDEVQSLSSSEVVPSLTTSDYWETARTPLSSLIFLLPVLTIYEVGILMTSVGGTEVGRNGADYWIRHSLGNAGVTGVFLPIFVIGGLLIWHIRSKDRSIPNLQTFEGMLAESVLYAIALVLIGRFEDRLFQAAAAGSELSIASPNSHRLLMYLGAGIYEEFLFRLCLLPGIYFLSRVVLPPKPSAVLAVVASSLLFACAHHLGPAGEEFVWFHFTFRLTAGLAFSVMFVLRGFGITVGCHAIYDLLVGLLGIG